jgi:hypothetical protein
MKPVKPGTIAFAEAAVLLLALWSPPIAACLLAKAMDLNNRKGRER